MTNSIRQCLSVSNKISLKLSNFIGSHELLNLTGFLMTLTNLDIFIIEQGLFPDQLEVGIRSWVGLGSKDRSEIVKEMSDHSGVAYHFH